jgi:hypothetical protein
MKHEAQGRPSELLSMELSKRSEKFLGNSIRVLNSFFRLSSEARQQFFHPTNRLINIFRLGSFVFLHRCHNRAAPLSKRLAKICVLIASVPGENRGKNFLSMTEKANERESLGGGGVGAEVLEKFN